MKDIQIPVQISDIRKIDKYFPSAILWLGMKGFDGADGLEAASRGGSVPVTPGAKQQVPTLWPTLGRPPSPSLRKLGKRVSPKTNREERFRPTGSLSAYR